MQTTCSFLTKMHLRRPMVGLYLFLVLFISVTVHGGQENPGKISDRCGLAVSTGYTYDPSDDIGFTMLTGFALFDYDKIWPHRAPEALRFKIEASAGSTWTPDWYFMASASMFAQFYVDRFKTTRIRPYIEGGIGGIYTDWRVKGQGSKLNFNPQLGIGAEWTFGTDVIYLFALRLNHISNAGLDDDNRGVNSAVFVIGRFF